MQEYQLSCAGVGRLKFGLLWKEETPPVISRVILGLGHIDWQELSGEYPNVVMNSAVEIDQLMREIMGFLSGRGEPLQTAWLETASLPPFTCSTLEALLKSVPRGKVISYGDLAKLVGCDMGARAVGNAMKDNPFPLFFPCHRVVKGDGSIGEYGGSVEYKRLLLKNEGVEIGDDDTIDGRFFIR